MRHLAYLASCVTLVKSLLVHSRLLLLRGFEGRAVAQQRGRRSDLGAVLRQIFLLSPLFFPLQTAALNRRKNNAIDLTPVFRWSMARSLSAVNIAVRLQCAWPNFHAQVGTSTFSCLYRVGAESLKLAMTLKCCGLLCYRCKIEPYVLKWIMLYDRKLQATRSMELSKPCFLLSASISKKELQTSVFSVLHWLSGFISRTDSCQLLL